MAEAGEILIKKKTDRNVRVAVAVFLKKIGTICEKGKSDKNGLERKGSRNNGDIKKYVFLIKEKVKKKIGSCSFVSKK